MKTGPYRAPLRSPDTRMQPGRVGVLLTNVGTPDAPTASALRRFLSEFLSDRRVVDVWKPLWWLILHGIILRTRPARSAAAYQRVWTDDGSPLLVGTIRLVKKISRRLAEVAGTDVPVAVGMGYGNPSIAVALRELAAASVTRLLVVPLFPQYFAGTTASTFDAVFGELKTWRWMPEVRTVSSYAADPGYLAALADTVRAARDEHGEPDVLLMSFHGLPQRYVDLGDPYHCDCLATAAGLASELGLPDNRWRVSFQSRFGREPWLQPYTDEVVRRLPGEGIKNVHVICPGFAIDCLETIDEIGLEAREAFTHAGGDTFHYIPALNDSDSHANALTAIAQRHLQGWLPEDD